MKRVEDLIKIIFNDGTLEINKKGTITGEIYFQIGDTFFPGENWNDFIVIILTCWNESADLLASSSSKVAADFRFMDGPFTVQGKKSEDSESVSLNFVKRTLKGEEVLHSIDIDSHVLRSFILSVSRRVLQVINEKQWKMNDDIVELKKIVAS